MTSRFTMAVHALGMAAWAERERPGEPLTSERIALSIHTNPVVVRRVLADLRRAGLVRTRRGAGGGVSLARPADRITLRCVWEAVEGQERLFCGYPDGPNPRCPLGPLVAGYLETLYGRAEASLKASLGKVTVEGVARHVVARLRAARPAAQAVP